ncbi:MAG: hypothetical protein HC917_20100 [Richelia sp. SM2_1_7]|nr:hypothetical protein [Richelia sp. SM2_1_7]
MHDDGTLKFWEIPSGKQLSSLKAHPSHTPLAISSNGETLLIQNAGDVKRFRRIATGAEFGNIDNSYIESTFATTSNGKYVLIQSGRTVNLHDMITGSKIRSFTEVSPGVSEIFVSPDQKTFLSVNEDDYKLWNLETGKELLTLIQGDSRSNSVFTPDSTTLISLPWHNNYLKIWDVNTGKLTHKFCINSHATEPKDAQIKGIRVKNQRSLI